MLGRARTPDEVAWHEVECWTYSADLPLWEELAEKHGGPILELGCGTGRVALELARRGHEVLGLDTERELVETLNARAGAAGIPARAIIADAASFQLDEVFPLVIAPMQLVQLLDQARRRAMLARARARLEPGGILAAALVEAARLLGPTTQPACDELPPSPDVRELDGWIYSSLPLNVRRANGAISIERLRQAVAPGGALTEEVDITELEPLSPGELENEARDVGLLARPRREVPPTDWHVGSTVCVLEAP
jgi:SAM-dependent methyltransferase